MKNSRISSKSRISPSNHSPRSERSDFDDGRLAPAGSRPDKNRIEWPSTQELARVSRTLTKVTRAGKRREQDGDYFRSGDLAYQLHEIIRATSDLLKKVQPNKNMNSPHGPD